MTTLDATVPAAQTGTCAPAGGIVRFLGDARAFWQLLAHGAVLLMFTLGIYRFWLTTDIRRFLWSNTELAGESFEYTGTARELLLGFLIAIAILVPLYAVFFLMTLRLGEASTLLGLLLLTFLGHYAVYRARRYRLTRTVYRGVRFHQTGSAWRYAVCALFWWTLIVLTAGLAYPFAQSRLERFKMRNTFFGNLPGRFEGSGLLLLLRGFVLWFLAVVPVVAGLIATLFAINWEGSGGRVGRRGPVELARDQRPCRCVRLLRIDRHLASAFVCHPLPDFSGHGAALVGVRVALRRRDSDIAPAHRAGVRRLCALSVVCAAVHAGGGDSRRSPARLCSPDSPGSSIRCRTKSSRRWPGLRPMSRSRSATRPSIRPPCGSGCGGASWNPLDISNLAVLEHVAAAGQPASPVGEGLADALSVGGI